MAKPKHGSKTVLGLILAGAAIFAAWMTYHVNAVRELPSVPFEFSIKEGSSLRSVANQMRDAGVLPDAWSFVLLARLLGRSGEIKAGNYELTAGVSPLQLLVKMTRGDVSQSEIMFIEGWTFKQVRKALDEHQALRHDTANLSEAEILKLVDASEPSPEGLFFPDTYFFANGSSDLAIFKRAYHTMQQQLENAWANRAPGLPYATPYEALTLASIVEKETGKSSERSLIAGVFVNRLRLGMKLQTDPAVIYGLGDSFDGNLRKRDLVADQAYNTYTRTGLPPTPIAMPGLASIQAALRPAETDALYFVAKGDGTSHFSSSLAEHNKAVTKYQKRRDVSSKGN